jgi:site-specific DNA recombinase
MARGGRSAAHAAAASDHGGETLYLVYIRVSGPEQVQKGFSLPEQRAELCGLAEKEGARAANLVEFREEGESGKEMSNRPVFQQLMARAALEAGRGRRVRVLMLHPDRFHRRLRNQLQVGDEWDKLGVSYFFTRVPSIDGSASGKLQLQILGAVAEYESARIAERIASGKLGSARAGNYIFGCCPYGYRVVTVKGDGADKHARHLLEPVALDAETVERIFREIATGASVRGLAVTLQKEGARAPKGGRWTRGTIRGIIKNETYTGVAYAGKSRWERGRVVAVPREEWVAIKVPALVSAKLFRDAQAQLARNMTVLNGRPPKVPALLRGLAKCPCGQTMAVLSGKGGKNARYVCPSLSEGQPCGNRLGWMLRPADRAAWASFEAFMKNPTTLLAALAKEKASGRGDTGKLQRERERVAAVVAKLEKREQRWNEVLGDSDLDTPTLRAQLKANQVERLAQAAKLRALDEALADPTQEWAVLVQRWAPMLAQLAEPDKARLFRLACREVRMTKDKGLVVHLRPGLAQQPESGRSFSEPRPISGSKSGPLDSRLALPAVPILDERRRSA